MNWPMCEKENRVNKSEKRVIAAREVQAVRLKEYRGIYYNAQLNPQLMEKYCIISDAGQLLLKKRYG
jgi:predicted ATPase with chaperone activity